MAQPTYIARKGADADFAAVTATTITASGTTTGSVLLPASGTIDLNGEADALVLDADGNTTISAPTDNQIDIEINNADDFRFTANTFTALAGSTIAADTIAETTGAAGVTVDSFLIKDGGFVAAGVTDQNGLKLILDADADTSITADTDDTIDIEIAGADDFQLTANTFTALSGSTIATNTIAETTAGSGVTIDGLLVKDGIVGTRQAITGDGAITVQNANVYLSKGSAAAITIVAPTAGTQDGLRITVIAATAQAHVITCATDGFNAKGASGTLTFGGAIGDSVTIVADTGHWYATARVNVTPA